MLDDFENSSPFYVRALNFELEETSTDFIDQMIEAQHKEIEEERLLNYYEDHTDFEHKQIKENNQEAKGTYFSELENNLSKALPEQETEQEKKDFGLDELLDIGKEMLPDFLNPEAVAKKIAGEGSSSLGMGVLGDPGGLQEKTKKLARTDIVKDSPLGGVAEAVASAISFKQDYVNGIKRSVAKTLAQLPKWVQSGLAEIGQKSDALDEANRVIARSIETQTASSGEHINEGMDVPSLAGEILGHFVVPGGVGAAVLKATKGMGVLTKGASLLVSEAALGSVITDKESGTLLNLFWEKNEAERVPIMLRMLHVNEDDSDFEARLKGALEGILPVSIGLAFQGLKRSKSSIIAMRDAAVLKQLNRKPDLSHDFISRSTNPEFSEKEFKQFIFNDFMKDEIDSGYNSFSAFLKDEEGSFSPFGILLKEEKIIDGAKKNLTSKIQAKKDRLERSLKSKKYPEQAKKLKDEIKKVDEEIKNLDDFNTQFKEQVKTGKVKEARGTFKKIMKVPTVEKGIKESFSHTFKSFEKQVDFFNNMRKDDLTLYNSLRGVFHGLTIKNAGKEVIEDANFLTLMTGEGGDLQDVVNIVRDQKLAYKEIDEVTKKFFNFDIKTYSEAQLNKTIQDFADTYGLDHAQLMKLKREELLALPEVVGIERYIMSRAMDDLGNKAKKLSEAVADGTPDSKRSLQMKVISFADAYSGMKKISQQAAQRRSEAGRTLSLYRKSTKERLFEQVTSKELEIPDILSDEVQMKFIEKLMSAEPGEMKRIGNKINDIMELVKKNKISSEEVWKQFVKGETLDKITHNLSVYAYNNMLWGVTTMLKNYVGLHINRQVDKLEDAIVKYTNESAYYGMEDFDLDHQREILEVMARLDSNIEGSLNLVNSSKLLPGLVNADGTAKSSKQIWKESYLLGKSMLDPGSEKFGVGYKSFTETDIAVLKSHANFFGGENVTDDMVRSYFNDSIMSDASKATSGNKYWEGLKVHAAAPLRALNATDDMFKAKILQEKMLLYAKQKVNKRLSGMNDELFNAYREDLDTNYYRDLQVEMNNIDNFDDALSTAREITLTKQYGSGYGGDQFKLMGADVGVVSSAFQKSKIIRFFYPFARIATNISDYLSQLTPGMHVPEGVPLIGGKTFHINSKMVEELSAGGYRSEKARAKIKVGLAISGVATYMARTNLITGSEPEDRAGREAWRTAGLKADSLNLPGFSIPLNLIDPFGKYLKMIADMSNTAARHINDGDDGYLDNIIPFNFSMAFSVARLATPEVLVSTLSAIAEASSRYQRYGAGATGAAAVAKMVGTIVSKGIPFSAMFRYIAGPDEVQRTFEYNKDGVDELATGFNAFYKNTFQKTTSVKNLFNDSVYHYNLPKDLVSDASDQSMINKYVPQFISKIAKIKETPREPIYKKLRELVLDLPASTYKSKDLPLPSLKRHISFRGETVALNNTQYNELIGYTNGYLPDGSTFMLPMKEYLNDLVTKEWFNNTDVDLQSLMIRQVVGKYHKLGRSMFKAQNEEYQKDMLNKVHKRMGLE